MRRRDVTLAAAACWVAVGVILWLGPHGHATVTAQASRLPAEETPAQYVVARLKQQFANAGEQARFLRVRTVRVGRATWDVFVTVLPVGGDDPYGYGTSAGVGVRHTIRTRVVRAPYFLPDEAAAG